MIYFFTVAAALIILLLLSVPTYRIKQHGPDPDDPYPDDPFRWMIIAARYNPILWRLFGFRKTTTITFVGSGTVWHRLYEDGRMTRCSSSTEGWLSNVNEARKRLRKVLIKNRVTAGIEAGIGASPKASPRAKFLD